MSYVQKFETVYKYDYGTQCDSDRGDMGEGKTQFEGRWWKRDFYETYFIQLSRDCHG